MAKLIKNVVSRVYRFLLTYEDGKEQELDVIAESLSSAELLLPSGIENVEFIGEFDKE